jgi:hypothetical protein
VSDRISALSLASWKAMAFRSPAVQRMIVLNQAANSRVHLMERTGWFVNP